MPGFDKQSPLLKKLGRHSVGNGCLYINRLGDVDMSVLKQLVIESAKAQKPR